jgi:RNA polymerase sigma-32 factor
MTGTALTLSNPSLVLTGPVGSLDAYIERVSAIPMLSREDELDLARRYRDHDDLDAARDLVLSHLRFVVHIARGYLGYGLPVGDLIQEGNVGLMKAVKRFDPDMGVRLVSFAVHWIRAEIHEFVIRNWRLVRVATTKAQRKLFFNLRRLKKNLAWLSDDETRAVAGELGVHPREVREMEQRLSARDLSFDPAPDTDDDDGIASPSLYLPSAETDPATAIEQEQWDGVVAESLTAALGTLDERSRTVVRARWLAEEKRTLQDLADDYGVSAERIRQIEAVALNKLRAAMTSKGDATL